jgi:hypothetical protein
MKFAQSVGGSVCIHARIAIVNALGTGGATDRIRTGDILDHNQVL